MKTPLNRGVIEARLKALQQAKNVESEISERADYIIHAIAKAFGRKFDWWAFSGSNEDNNMGNLSDSLAGVDEFYFDGVTDLCHADVALIKEGEWGFHCSFPTRWLYQDFEEELKIGILKYRASLVEEKNKAAKIKAIKEIAKVILIKSAKSKLTKAELKALKLA